MPTIKTYGTLDKLHPKMGMPKIKTYGTLGKWHPKNWYAKNEDLWNP
jgi:hypothetical protein